MRVARTIADLRKPSVSADAPCRSSQLSLRGGVQVSRVSHDRWSCIRKTRSTTAARRLAVAASHPLRRGRPRASRTGLGIVGARKATPYGLWAAERFATAAGERGVTVVSGAAIRLRSRGPGRCAGSRGRQRGRARVRRRRRLSALEPRASRPAATRRRGRLRDALGSAPQRWALRERNRIIAGLSRAVLIVEAGLPSGTFSTADYALEAGREVLVVPGSIRLPSAAARTAWLRQGATPVTDVSELAFELEAPGGRTSSSASARPHRATRRAPRHHRRRSVGPSPVADPCDRTTSRGRSAWTSVTS